MVDVSHRSVTHMVQQSGFDDSMFISKSQRQRYWSERPAVVNTWDKVASQALHPKCWLSSIRHLQLHFEVALTRTRPAVMALKLLDRLPGRIRRTLLLAHFARILLLCALIGSGPVGGKGPTAILIVKQMKQNRDIIISPCSNTFQSIRGTLCGKYR